ncbi:MAG: hypothetical protein U9O94_00930 [Nanoarchaeota archaeon]|nr:hypothetical protein [Nanoarchaeota archaeon]
MNLSKLKKLWLKRMKEKGCFFKYEQKELIDSYVRDVAALMNCRLK